MARTSIQNTINDLQSDEGSVLWSFVQGEQVEFPVTLNFLNNVFGGYVYEAVVVEALNIYGDSSVPTEVQPSGNKMTLVVRIPTDRGTWSAPTAYNREDVVLYNGLYYKLYSGAGRVNATTPDADPVWELYVPNKVYIQFPKTLSVAPAYTVQPTSVSPIYGFFELRVTEPDGGIYKRTWKPMRGVVEIHFSPTEITADV